MKRYFAKPDTWFKEGTECFRHEEIYPAGWTFDKDGVSHASATYTGTYIVGSSENSKCMNFVAIVNLLLWRVKSEWQKISNYLCGSSLGL